MTDRTIRTSDQASRSLANPLLSPHDVPPGQQGVVVVCVLNPGAFTFQGKIGLLLRVAEQPPQQDGLVSALVLKPEAPGGVEVIDVAESDPALSIADARTFEYQGITYLTTLSHLRLAWSEDGIHFDVSPVPTLRGQGALETFGIEDCRVTEIDGIFYLTYTAISSVGFGIGLMSTTDWQHFQRHGMIFPPNNKDCALFPEKIGGSYFAFHRPSLPGQGTNNIWLSASPDLLHWGKHVCLAQTRPGMWDAQRIGAGGSPIRTEEGWLEIYHGADEQNRYCLGALLLDLNDPSKVLARSQEPLMEPWMEYEQQGFFGNVVFTNGGVVNGDCLSLYYGASDQFICQATFSVREILASLKE